MKQFLFPFLILLILLSSCAPIPTVVPPSETSIPPTSTVFPTETSTPFVALDSFYTVQHMQHGLNVGVIYVDPPKGEFGFPIEEYYFDLIRQSGFDFVRISIFWSLHAGKSMPYAIEPSYFARVDQVTQWALKRGLYVVLNFSNYEELFNNPNSQLDRYRAIWRQVAEHYKDYPPTVLFELLNEPNGALDAPTWNGILTKTLAVVRESNPVRNVVIGPADWNVSSALPTLQLPENDQHIIATFHYYQPMVFTHQGAEWVSGSDKWLGTTWDATDEQKNEVIGDFDKASDWAKENNRPILLGEFGVFSKADEASRVRWTDFVAREAESHGFAWAYFEFVSDSDVYNPGFGIYGPKTNTWREDLLKALIP